MTYSSDARSAAFRPKPHPEWVARLNEEGSHMDIGGIVPLDENSLLSTARANTGLEDFGEDSWHEPFQVLIKAFEEESKLTLMGRLMCRSEILGFLEARLNIEETYKQHPAIEDEEIVQPLLITGQGRTGTSFMQNLLAEDPANGTLRTWEVYFPCPPPEAATYNTDPRIEKADKLVTQWNRVTPEITGMHEFSGWIPAESLHLQCISFFSPSWFPLIGQVPSYSRYMAQQDMTQAYRYEKRILKLLQWKNPRRTWILKTPDYINFMPEVLQVYPDARLLWLHRDPIKANASAVNLLGTYFWARSDHPFIPGAYDTVADAKISAQMMARPIDWLADGTVPAQQLYNLQYLDFIKDPGGCVRDAYAHLGIERDATSFESMQAYLEANPREKRPAHQYDAGDKAWIEADRKHYQRYQDYFQVPSEI